MPIITRRAVLAGLGAAALLPELAATAAPKNPRRIDVHHHHLPPRYLEKAREFLISSSPYGNEVVKWTPAVSLQQMDQYGIATAMLSNPASWRDFTPEEARALVRDSNEYAAQLRHDHPGRFGVFACVPMPDVDASLKEIDYAFGTLKADGVQLTTSYGTQYPGDPAFDPLFAELDRRKAVVFIHPAAPGCCARLVPGIPAPTVEFMFDVTRCITSLLFRGTFTRYPNIRFIFTHDGAALPMLADRITRNATVVKGAGFTSQEAAMAVLQRLYYDVTTSTSRPSLSGFRAFAPVSQMLFGTDIPFLNPAQTAPGLDRFGFSAKELAAINRGNAERLFPALRG
jgi:6-methylsalicylate decarboxylase